MSTTNSVLFIYFFYWMAVCKMISTFRHLRLRSQRENSETFFVWIQLNCHLIKFPFSRFFLNHTMKTPLNAPGKISWVFMCARLLMYARRGKSVRLMYVSVCMLMFMSMRTRIHTAYTHLKFWNVNVVVGAFNVYFHHSLCITLAFNWLSEIDTYTFLCVCRE